MINFLCDVQLSREGIEFTVFQKLIVARFNFSEIKKVEPVGFWGLGIFFKAAYNMTNRFGSQDMLIVLGKGWFARRIVITPENPYYFCDVLAKNGVSVDPVFFQ